MFEGWKENRGFKSQHLLPISNTFLFLFLQIFFLKSYGFLFFQIFFFSLILLWLYPLCSMFHKICMQLRMHVLPDKTGFDSFFKKFNWYNSNVIKLASRQKDVILQLSLDINQVIRNVISSTVIQTVLNIENFEIQATRLGKIHL